MNQPISVIVPCYNQAQFLNEALGSILQQTYQNWECIIINDGSTDETEIIAKEWLEKDSRFKYISKKNGGLSSARNAGLKIAKGEFIQFLDADDFLDIKKFEMSLNALGTNKTDCVISNFKMFSNGTKEFSEPYCNLFSGFFSFNNIILRWGREFTIPIHCGLFHSSIFFKFRFPENLKALEDWIMWLYVFQQKKVQSVFLNQYLAYYRIHGENISKKSDFMKYNKLIAVAYIKQKFNIEETILYSFCELLKKDHEIENLNQQIRNYKKSRTYIYSQKIQKYPIGNLFLKIIKIIE